MLLCQVTEDADYILVSFKDDDSFSLNYVLLFYVHIQFLFILQHQPEECIFYKKDLKKHVYNHSGTHTITHRYKHILPCKKQVHYL